MLNNELNSSLITQATNNARNRVVISDTDGVVRDSLTFRPVLPHHSKDFRNFVSDSIVVARKNQSFIDTDKLFVLKSKKLIRNPEITWDDSHVMTKLNKISHFKPDIQAYRLKNAELLQQNITQETLLGMSGVSERVTKALLKTVYYIEGPLGLPRIRENLYNIINSGHFNPDCLKMYNFLIYSAPFMFVDFNANSGMFTPAMFYHCPYEIIATNLITYIDTMQLPDLNFVLRMQMKLEASYLPDVGYYRELYNSTLGRMDLIRYHTTRGVFAGTLLALTPATIRLATLILTNSGNTITNTVPNAGLIENMSPEELDLIISTVNFLIYQM